MILVFLLEIGDNLEVKENDFLEAIFPESWHDLENTMIKLTKQPNL